MKHLIPTLLLLACSFGITLSGEEKVLYEFKLKNGQNIVGYGEDIGVDRLKIHIVFKGKVMASKEVKITDVVSRKKIKVLEKEAKSEPTKDEDTDTKFEEPIEKFYEFQKLKKEHYHTLEKALSQLGNTCKSFNPPPKKEIYEKHLDAAQVALKNYLESLANYHQALTQIINTRSNNTAKTKFKNLFEEELELSRSTLTDSIGKNVSRYNRYLAADAWVKSANLTPIKESFAKSSPEVLSRVKLINKSLKTFREIREGKSYDYNAVLWFLKNNEYLLTYAESR